MVLLKAFELGTDLGNERPYIVGLQSELADGKRDLEKVAANIELLDSRMGKVKQELARLMCMRCLLTSRKDQQSSEGSTEPGEPHSIVSETTSEGSILGLENVPSLDLHAYFNSNEVKNVRGQTSSSMLLRWEQGTFQKVKKLSDAKSNRGVVWLMEHKDSKKMFAVKTMPNSWIQESYAEFFQEHPNEAEMPWVDIGCTRYLNSVGYQFACTLEGVYRSHEETFVMSSFASGGDLFDTTLKGEAVGPKRELAMAPWVLQVLAALQQLHDMGIVHRDVSLENVLLTGNDQGGASVKLRDFSMAAAGRIHNVVRGKPSYQAPEMHSGGDYDAFLSDSFAAGVLVYALLLKDYPWLSTKPGKCMRFQYVVKNGLRAYMLKACAQNAEATACISEDLLKLLEGMLMIKPDQRLTLGEKQLGDRRSVWHEPWLQSYGARFRSL